MINNDYLKINMTGAGSLQTDFADDTISRPAEKSTTANNVSTPKISSQEALNRSAKISDEKQQVLKNISSGNSVVGKGGNGLEVPGKHPTGFRGDVPIAQTNIVAGIDSDQVDYLVDTSLSNSFAGIIEQLSDDGKPIDGSFYGKIATFALRFYKKLYDGRIIRPQTPESLFRDIATAYRNCNPEAYDLRRKQVADAADFFNSPQFKSLQQSFKNYLLADLSDNDSDKAALRDDTNSIVLKMLGNLPALFNNYKYGSPQLAPTESSSRVSVNVTDFNNDKITASLDSAREAQAISFRLNNCIEDKATISAQLQARFDDLLQILSDPNMKMDFAIAQKIDTFTNKFFDEVLPENRLRRWDDSAFAELKSMISPTQKDITPEQIERFRTVLREYNPLDFVTKILETKDLQLDKGCLDLLEYSFHRIIDIGEEKEPFLYFRYSENKNMKNYISTREKIAIVRENIKKLQDGGMVNETTKKGLDDIGQKLNAKDPEMDAVEAILLKHAGQIPLEIQNPVHNLFAIIINFFRSLYMSDTDFAQEDLKQVVTNLLEDIKNFKKTNQNDVEVIRKFFISNPNSSKLTEIIQIGLKEYSSFDAKHLKNTYINDMETLYSGLSEIVYKILTDDENADNVENGDKKEYDYKKDLEEMLIS